MFESTQFSISIYAMASYYSDPRPISYAEAVQTFNSPDVQNDMNDACDKLATAMSSMMHKFDSITKQMHTIDLMRLNAPLKPRWDSIRQDFTGLLWQFRTNSGVISGRLKLFCTAVLPMAARNFDGRSGRSSYHNENIQMLKSYMALSADYAAATRTLTDLISKLSAQLVAFMTEFTKIANRHAVSGQKEMGELSQRLSELATHIQCLFTTTTEISNTDVAHLVFTSSRLVSSAGRTTGRSRLTRRPIALDGDLTNIGRAYEHADRKRNEVAHVQYAAQLRQDRSDPIAATQTMLSSFLLDQLLSSESGLSIFLSIWARLRTDCNEIYHWVKNPGQSAVPSAIACYVENGSTLYAPFVNALDAYLAAVDPSIHPECHEAR